MNDNLPYSKNGKCALIQTWTTMSDIACTVYFTKPIVYLIIIEIDNPYVFHFGLVMNYKMKPIEEMIEIALPILNMEEFY